MRLALIVVVVHVRLRVENCPCHKRVALTPGIVVRLMSSRLLDVRFAVLSRPLATPMFNVHNSCILVSYSRLFNMRLYPRTCSRHRQSDTGTMQPHHCVPHSPLIPTSSARGSWDHESEASRARGWMLAVETRGDGMSDVQMAGTYLDGVLSQGGVFLDCLFNHRAVIELEQRHSYDLRHLGLVW
jgi:hypothetical protein